MSVKSKLTSGRAEWQAYRKNRGPSVRLKVSDFTFSFQAFIKWEFANIDFENCEFQEVDLSGSDFTGATFSDCKFLNTNFSGAKLAGSRFLRQEIESCNFSGTTAPRISLEDCRIRASKFNSSNLSKANFTRVIGEDLEIKDCRLSQLRAEAASFTKCDFRLSDLGSSNIAYSTFNSCNWSHATISKSDIADTRWSDCKAHELKASNVNARNGYFSSSDFRKSVFDGLVAVSATFRHCSFSQSNLIASDLTSASIKSSRLDYSLLCKCKLNETKISDCMVFGISCWGTDFAGCRQERIKINASGQYSISVNSIEYAYFLHQSLENSRFKQFFESTSEKLVLILGRFTGKSKDAIEIVRSTITSNQLIPVVFDFETPEGHDLTEVVLSLALMSRFIIVDLSDPRCAPYELGTIAPNVNSPIAALIKKGENPFAMFSDLENRYAWVLAPLTYERNSEISDIVSTLIIPKCEEYITDRNAR